MRILHFSDTHLGFQAFDGVTAEGINAREQDGYLAFRQVIDHVLDTRPDVVVHSGDFFHRPSPSNRALTFGMEQLRRLHDAKIPIVLIAGNHETPKTVYTSPILRALRTVDGVYPIFGQQLESVEFDGLKVHGVPHINDTRILHAELERLEAQPGRWNLLLLHTSLGKKFLMDEYGEQVFPAQFEAKLTDFQYVALGHWHNFQHTDATPHTWYSGSTERLSDTEIGFEKGFVEIDAAADGTYQLKFRPIATRPWLQLALDHCEGKTVAELRAELETFASGNDTRQAILSLQFNDIRAEQTLELSNSRLREIFPESFQLLPKRRPFAEKAFIHRIEADQFDRLDRIFADYLREHFRDTPDVAERLVGRARDYFEQQSS